MTFEECIDRLPTVSAYRGDAGKMIELKKDPDKNCANLQKAMAMAKLFKNYPPRTSK
jgi:hypothetical protein